MYTGNINLDRPTLEAFERYVMAQFRFGDAKSIQEERQAAIDSLIPGTLNYYHLFFLDLGKTKKKVELFTPDELKLWAGFKEKHGKTSQFMEVEMLFLVLNRLDLLDGINDKTSNEEIQKNLDLIEYIFNQYVKSKPPLFMRPNYKLEGN